MFPLGLPSSDSIPTLWSPHSKCLASTGQVVQQRLQRSVHTWACSTDVWVANPDIQCFESNTQRNKIVKCIIPWQHIAQDGLFNNHDASNARQQHIRKVNKSMATRMAQGYVFGSAEDQTLSCSSPGMPCAASLRSQPALQQHTPAWHSSRWWHNMISVAYQRGRTTLLHASTSSHQAIESTLLHHGMIVHRSSKQTQMISVPAQACYRAFCAGQLLRRVAAY